MGKRVAILQSNYIPWKGYFDLIGKVDEFVLYDEVQYTKRDWRNRNKIKTPGGLQWLTIPVIANYASDKISEIVVAEKDWSVKHWKSITLNYSRAPYFKMYKDQFGDFYNSSLPEHLSMINRAAIEMINGILNIKTKISSSADFHLHEGRNERLIGICTQANATVYLSGPAAKDYMDESKFNEAGIQVEWMDYSGYREYPQLFPPFEHGVTVLDLIFNTGPQAAEYINVKEIATHGK